MDRCHPCPHAETFRLAMIAGHRYHNDVRHDGYTPREAMAHLALAGITGPPQAQPLYAGTVDSAIPRLEAGESLWTVAEDMGVSPSRLQSALALRRRQLDAGDCVARISPDTGRL